MTEIKSGLKPIFSKLKFSFIKVDTPELFGIELNDAYCFLGFVSCVNLIMMSSNIFIKG